MVGIYYNQAYKLVYGFQDNRGLVEICLAFILYIIVVSSRDLLHLDLG